MPIKVDNIGSIDTSTLLVGFTEGSVLFVDSAGTFAEDNANLFWDDTNDTLVIGQASGASTSSLIIDATKTEAFLVRRDSDAGDVLIVDTTNGRLGINITPEWPLHVKTMSGTQNFVIERNDATVGSSLLWRLSSGGGTNYARLRLQSSGNSNTFQLVNQITNADIDLLTNNADHMTLNATTGDVELIKDAGLLFGAGGDARLWYDGTNTYFNPQVVGSGNLIMQSGNFLLGQTSSQAAGLGHRFEISQAANWGGMVIATYSTTDAQAGRIDFKKSSNASFNSFGIVADDEYLGQIAFFGGNGNGSFDPAALIRAVVDGTPGATNDMPGRLEFHTTPDGSSSPVERIRIDQNGDLLIVADNKDITFGAGSDAVFYYNGTHMVHSPDVVGVGGFKILNVSATSTNSLIIDHVTTPYTGSGPELRGMDVDLQVSTAASSSNIHLYGMDFLMTNAHVINGSPVSPTQNTYGGLFAIQASGAHSATPLIDLTENNYAYSAQVARSGSLTSTLTTINNFGSNFLITDTIAYSGSGTLTVNNYGFKSTIASSGNETSGTLIKNNYGAHISVTGSSQGTSTGYGIFIGTVTGSDTNWAFYNNTTASNFLGPDNQTTYIGTGSDLALSHNGTNSRIINITGELIFGSPSIFAFGTGAAGVDYILKFDGETNDGSITYMEDEDRFDFDNDVNIGNTLTVLGEFKGTRTLIEFNVSGSGAGSPYLNYGNTASSSTKGFIANRPGTIVGFSYAATISSFSVSGDMDFEVHLNGSMVHELNQSVSSNGVVTGNTTIARSSGTDFVAGDVIAFRGVPNSGTFNWGAATCMVEIQLDT